MKIEAARKLMLEKARDKLRQHCLGVEETSVKLARAYGIDEKKAALAGLVHDYGKLFPEEELCRIALENGIGDDVILKEPVLLHAPVGAWLLQKDLGIKDEEILEAVRLHTTGFPAMSPLAKIIYLADYIEPGRNCPGVEEVRAIAFQDLEKALLAAVNMTIRYVLERGMLLHPYSISFRNTLILSFRKIKRGLGGNEAG